MSVPCATPPWSVYVYAEGRKGVRSYAIPNSKTVLPRRLLQSDTYAHTHTKGSVPLSAQLPASPSHRVTTTDTNTNISTSAHQHISTSTHQHISTSAHQHISTSAHQHNCGPSSCHYHTIIVPLPYHHRAITIPYTQGRTGGVHTALSDQNNRSPYSLHDIYYLEDRESRSRVWKRCKGCTRLGAGDAAIQASAR